MTQARKTEGEIVVSLTAPDYVGYCDYFFHTKIGITVQNTGDDNVTLTLKIKENELILPYETQVFVPFRGSVFVQAEDLFSPKLLAENDALTPFLIAVEARAGQRQVRAEKRVVALPFDFWEGILGNAERLAFFIRPDGEDCARVVREAAKTPKGRNRREGEMLAFRIFSYLAAMGIEKYASDFPVRAAEENIIAGRRANAVSLALFAAGCLERAGFHAVVAVGADDDAAVGVWRYDACFLDAVTDDREAVEKYTDERLNNLIMFDTDVIFSAGTPSAAVKRFREKLKKGKYALFADICRCRLSGIGACPARERTKDGYRLVCIPRAPALPLRRSARKEGFSRAWERALLDFSEGNALLNFTKNSVASTCVRDADLLLPRLKAGMRLTLCTQWLNKENGQDEEQMRLEEERGVLRVYGGEERAQTLKKLYKQSAEVEEETGATALYLCFGTMEYPEHGAPRRAPVVLAPVSLTKIKGSGEYVIRSCEGEFFVNTTLFERLKGEYGLDLYPAEQGGIKQTLSAIRERIKREVGFSLCDEAYLSLFSFRGFALWNELREHSEEFEKNAVVRALAGEGKPPAPINADGECILPLPADETQREAVEIAHAGESFVLHGPPGTGKSQTIANIICDALYAGKRVLFVAEKQAALDVVKGRLERVGVGEFCLTLNARTDREEAARRMERTLTADCPEERQMCRDELELAESGLKSFSQALYKKREAGFSVYDALLTVHRLKNAPAVIGIESGFYEGLNEETLNSLRRRVMAAASAARECAGVGGAPFDDVGLTQCTEGTQRDALCFSGVLLAEIRRYKSYLSLFLSAFRQQTQPLTVQTLTRLREIVTSLTEGVCAPLKGENEEEWIKFYHANKRLDRLLSYYRKHYGTPLKIDLRKILSEEDFERAALRARRTAMHPLEREDGEELIGCIREIYRCAAEIAENTSLAKHFTSGGKIVWKRREGFLRPFYLLDEKCALVFSDFNLDAFLSACVVTADGHTMPALNGYLAADTTFSESANAFLSCTAADAEKLRIEDVPAYLFEKASSLIENIALLPARCALNRETQALSACGLTLMPAALSLSDEELSRGFDKCVASDFLSRTLKREPALTGLTAKGREEAEKRIALAEDALREETGKRLRARLIARARAAGVADLPLRFKEEGTRAFFNREWERAGALVPLVLASPAAVTLLPPKNGIFDLVIFDEASQLPEAEAVGALARARQAIVVGDPKQLPPTEFFRATAQTGASGSILESAIKAGFCERKLLWHYRSRHESLIAFSNVRYYENRLKSVPSPDLTDNRVRLVETDGVYERGGNQCNVREAEALVNEVVRRLQEPASSKKSLGVVTFSGAQKELIARILNRALKERGLEEAAYGGNEPLFVKNLENVQGDERDVILFSVCYGRDEGGKLTLNFGPLNRSGGWRRLNVAASRAREEMLVFSSLSPSDIDLCRTASGGVADLKAFLEFAKGGAPALARPACREEQGMGKYIADALTACGYSCRVGVGVSGMKVDVAVVDPVNPERFLLGILTDSGGGRDRAVLFPALLKKCGWQLIHVGAVDFYTDPKRELERVGKALGKLTGKTRAIPLRYERAYRAVRGEGGKTARFVTDGENDNEILERLKKIVAREEPISREFLKKRCLSTFGISHGGARVSGRLDALISACGFSRERALGADYFYRRPEAILTRRFRTERRSPLRRAEEDFTPFETVALIRGALEERVFLYPDELTSLVASVYGVRETERFRSFVSGCVSFGVERGVFSRSPSERISLAE